MIAMAVGCVLATANVALAGPPPEPLPDVTDEPDPPPDDSSVRDDDQLQRAMAAFARGSDNYNRAMYQEALGDFLEAATLYASPDFQYNIALCYEKLDKPEEAIAAFQTYLKTKKDVPDRANVEDRIRRLEAMVESGQKPSDMDDGKPVDTPPPAQNSNAGRGLVIGGAVLAGVGAALALGGGLGLGLAAKKRSDDLDAAQTGGNPDDLTFAEASDLEDKGKSLELGQIVTVAIGGAIVIGGVAMLAIGLSKAKKAKSGKTAILAPSFGRTAIGLSLTGRF
jgi:tetratricopeptide (TPR) repeat protein